MAEGIRVLTGLEGFPNMIVLDWGDQHGEILPLTYPEANKLQEDIRRALVIEGVTLRDAT